MGSMIALDVLLLLSVAWLFGVCFERLGQNAIVGYLLAGAILGPGALDQLGQQEQVEFLAELGVALLLFSIGLEFSWRELRKLGRIASVGGLCQIVLTMGVVLCVGLFLGWQVSEAIAIGAMIALSSTACVFRILVDRAEIDSVHGRTVVGILLLQDIAVIPLVLLVNMLGGEGSLGVQAVILVKKLLLLVPVVVSLMVLLNWVVPWVLGTRVILRNRELPILLAIITVLGSAWLTAEVGMSAALGAFMAGVLLGGSPYADQIRSDIVSLRTLLVTLFFSTIGMLVDPMWLMADFHYVYVGIIVVAIVVGKGAIIWLVVRLFRQGHAVAVASGLCLAQVGEFSFVLAEIARSQQVIDGEMFQYVISSTVLTLLVTPYLVGVGPRFGRKVQRWLGGSTMGNDEKETRSDSGKTRKNHVVIVGFGPAGQSVGQHLRENKTRVVVLDLNPRMVSVAEELGFEVKIGDGGQREMLEQVGVAGAQMVVVTIPDPSAVRRIIGQVRILNPSARIVARCRYHVYRWELEAAGAHVVIDEEEEVGRRIAEDVVRYLQSDQGRT